MNKKEKALKKITQNNTDTLVFYVDFMLSSDGQLASFNHKIITVI